MDFWNVTMNRIRNLCVDALQQSLKRVSKLTVLKKTRRRSCDFPCSVNSIAEIQSLELRRLLTTQVFTPSATDISVGVESLAQFSIDYSTRNPVNQKTIGVSLRMYYDSTQMTPDMAQIEQSAFPGATIQDQEDTNDLDQNAVTDRLVNFLWFDINGHFPVGNNLPIKLLDAVFTTSSNFESAEIGFTAEPPEGVTTDLPTVQLIRSTAHGDVDGDNDFDANDSFLIHLVQLSGSDSQIDQTKGSSPLTATEIRNGVAALTSVGDVDGDGDFDANDSFLIHLIKLSGTDSQIDQTKGNSQLSADQIKERVTDLSPGSSGNPAAVNIDSRTSEDTAAADRKMKASTSPASAPDAVFVDLNAIEDDTFRFWAQYF